MRADFATALDNLIAASGGRIWITSGDRDIDLQRKLWEDKLAEYGLPPDTDPDDPRAAGARAMVAPPGKSNHNRGIAADLGGDLGLAHRLAPQFGLWLPMDWEEWHIEPLGSRDDPDVDDQAYTVGPKGETVSSQQAFDDRAPDYNSILQRLVGSDVQIFTREQDPLFSELKSPILKLAPERANAPVFTTPRGGPTGIDEFMAALRDVESSGNYGAIGVPTEWGNATGAYQFLDSTWGYYKGYARAADAPPAIQDEKARLMMQEYYNQYGDWDSVAAAWYSGPGGNWSSNEVQEYVGKVKSRL